MLKHHGAIDGVTGSCHELTLADGRLAVTPVSHVHG
jgi:hypothetical protein